MKGRGEGRDKAERAGGAGRVQIQWRDRIDAVEEGESHRCPYRGEVYLLRFVI